MMNKVILSGLLISACLALSFPSHQYWFNKYDPEYAKNDDRWNYCDLKCLTLEKLVPDKDFVVVTFTATFK